ncbi:MAG TPA: AmmeMemoRadiSam system protein B [Candidatus Xenobia bacterium]|nr:AmmeMemoRadiSam system protein B [Candidatus Xenobia bacterium]
MRRAPAVAGRFYPARPADLRRELEGYIQPIAAREKALACVVPHAGIMYSGHVAGALYSRLEPVPRYIILCPNHTGYGAPLAIMSEGEWETPLGDVPIDSELATDLKNACRLLEEDAGAHRFEHSLEVQLPFLQFMQKEFRFVPIALGVGRFDALEELGEAIAEVVKRAEPRPLIVASSDLNHYEPDNINRRKDHMAIERILALDPRGLYDTVHRQDISMCGFGPAVSMLTAARKLGARDAELVRYANSGDITGDRSQVVGYAGILIR